MIPEEESGFFSRAHNNPPSMLALAPAREDLRQWLNEHEVAPGKTLAQRRMEFLKAAANVVVKTREDAGAAGDVIKLAGEVWDIIETERKRLTDPYFEVQKGLKAMADGFWADVDEAMQGVLLKINIFTQVEDDRIAAAQREQDEEIARMREAAGLTPKPAPSARRAIDYTDPGEMPPPPPPYAGEVAVPKRKAIRGDLGATVSARTQTNYRVTDVSKIPLHILNAPDVHAAIAAVVKRTAKDFGVPEGVEAITSTGNQIK